MTSLVFLVETAPAGIRDAPIRTHPTGLCSKRQPCGSNLPRRVILPGACIRRSRSATVGPAGFLYHARNRVFSDGLASRVPFAVRAEQPGAMRGQQPSQSHGYGIARSPRVPYWCGVRAGKPNCCAQLRLRCQNLNVARAFARTSLVEQNEVEVTVEPNCIASLCRGTKTGESGRRENRGLL